MAEYCRNIFGDALLIDPLEKYPVSLRMQGGVLGVQGGGWGIQERVWGYGGF